MDDDSSRVTTARSLPEVPQLLRRLCAASTTSMAAEASVVETRNKPAKVKKLEEISFRAFV